MIKHTVAIATIASTLTIVSTGLPLAAQINNDVDTPTVRPTRPIGDDDVGLPDGVEDPADSGLPDAGSPTTGNSVANGVIILEIDGVPTYYAPIAPNQVDLSGGNVPIYRLDRNSTTPNNANIDANATEDRSGGFVIYPPADSVEELEPEDILQ